jgi:hypothetical protein
LLLFPKTEESALGGGAPGEAKVTIKVGDQRTLAMLFLTVSCLVFMMFETAV